MLLAAVERDHLADQQFFIVSLFGKVFRGGFGHWDCSSCIFSLRAIRRAAQRTA